MDIGQKPDRTQLRGYPVDCSEVTDFLSQEEMPPRVSQDVAFEAKNVTGGTYRFGGGYFIKVSKP
jgi:hypothetical protein